MGAGPSSPTSEQPSPPSTSTTTPSPPLSSSPFSLPRSPAPSPSKLCEISEKQAEEFDEVITGLKKSEFEMLKDSKPPEIPVNIAAKLFHLPTASFDAKRSYLDDPDISNHPLLIKRILCVMLIDILEKYRDIFKKINELCTQCRSGKAVDDVEDTINDIITNDLIRAQTWVNSFNQFFFTSKNYRKDEYMVSLKTKFDKVRETDNMFENVDRIKKEMMAICMDAQKSQQVRSVAFTPNQFGGKSSRSTTKKRKQKQMKMKMKSSNYRSKTRNNKKKHNGNGLKK